MISENLTPFAFGPVTWLLRAGEYRLTVILKAGFSLGDDAVLQPSEDQPLPEGDCPPFEGPGDLSALERASDVVAYKPRAELLLNGTAYAPAEQGPRSVTRVGVQVGNLSKALAVFGERDFTGHLGDRVSEPEPFSSMPLTYANAYGGKGEHRNPVGKGRDGKSLPNIEYADHVIHSPADHPPPAGFGPISPNWEPRRSMMGTYGRDYLDKYWPGFPPDFDWGYFNAAPQDQQFNGYLRGDEEVTLEGMHPEQPLIRTRLPGVRIIVIREDHDGNITRLPMNLDTLHIDADQLSYHLTWRGMTDIATFEGLEIKRLGVLAESLDAPELDPAAYVQRMNAMLADQDREFEEESPLPEPEQETSEQASDSNSDNRDENPLPPDIDAKLEELKRLSPQPEPSDEPPELSPEAQAEAERIMAQIEAGEPITVGEQAASDEEAEPAWTRERVIAAALAGDSFADVDLSGLDLSHHVFGAVDFRGATLEDVDFADADLSGAQFAECPMDNARFDGATLKAVDLAGTKLAGASLCRADLTGATLTGADLENTNLDDSVLAETQCAGASFKKASLLRTALVQANLANADLTDAQLDEADLAACDATDALFSGTSLKAAAFSSAQLEGADFSDATLTNARLPSAKLAGAMGTGAKMQRVDLRHADLTGADFNGADLSQAMLDGATATDADFTEANLDRASLRRAVLNGTWLSSATIDEANLQEADCTDLQLDGTRARRTNFYRANVTTLRGSAGADFSGADFRQVTGEGAIFEGCIVDGADFAHAVLPGANFIRVSAVQTNFTAVDMPEARFTLADCREAVFHSANLFEGSLEAADLSRAVLDGANCYSVEFLDAKLGGAKIEGTNVLMTELSR